MCFRPSPGLGSGDARLRCADPLRRTSNRWPDCSREWDGGARHDRDVNAACNVLALGLGHQPPRWESLSFTAGRMSIVESVVHSPTPHSGTVAVSGRGGSARQWRRGPTGRPQKAGRRSRRTPTRRTRYRRGTYRRALSLLALLPMIRLWHRFTCRPRSGSRRGRCSGCASALRCRLVPGQVEAAPTFFERQRRFGGSMELGITPRPVRSVVERLGIGEQLTKDDGIGRREQRVPRPITQAIDIVHRRADRRYRPLHPCAPPTSSTPDHHPPGTANLPTPLPSPARPVGDPGPCVSLRLKLRVDDESVSRRSCDHAGFMLRGEVRRSCAIVSTASRSPATPTRRR